MKIKTTSKVQYDAKDFTIRELRTLQEEGDLLLDPDYQRNFVMDIKTCSLLVESLLLDIPIPVIYLVEENDNTYSVIDGKQRLTTFISFIKGTFIESNRVFALTGLDMLKQYNGKTFSEMDKAAQLKIKTSTLHTICIKKESSEDIKFQIFERLNTGSIKLNESEIRNSLYRGNYINLLTRLENDDTFNELINLPKKKQRMIYREYILRFFSFSRKGYKTYKTSMKKFCNEELMYHRDMKKTIEKNYENTFKHCLSLAKSVFGNKAFRRFKKTDDNNGKWNLALNLSLYDIQMHGFLHYNKTTIIQNADAIREALMQLMTQNSSFIDAIEKGTSDTKKVKTRFEIWLKTLENVIDDGKKVSDEKRYFSYAVREALYQKNKTCAICRQQILSIDDAHVDHIIPFSKGGKTVISNAQITHRFCNQSKGNKAVSKSGILNFEKKQLKQVVETKKFQEANVLENSIPIYAKYKNNPIEAELNTNNFSVKYNAINYKSVSTAAIAAKIEYGASLKNTENGWRFWRFLKNGKMTHIDELRK